MSIRKTLLIAFLGVGLISAILLASLAFVKATQALRVEIERNMVSEAASVSTSVDKMMFERLQNAAVWSQLDIMQDIQVRDVDKRLARFLSDLKAGYRGVYVSLSGTDAAGTVIASSEATLVGTTQNEAPDWLNTVLSGSNLALKLKRADSALTVDIDVPIASAFADKSLGQLRLQLDWSEIEEVLDRAGGVDERMLALVDGDGRVIAASEPLRKRGFLLSQALSGWRNIAGSVAQRSGAPLYDSDVIVAEARSRGYSGFEGFGWTTLVLQPVDRALAPVHRMAIVFVLVFFIIALFTIVVGGLVSHAIARPIVALTGFTRSYMRNKAIDDPPAVGKGEVGELTEVFVQMVSDIGRSQENLLRASKLAVVGEMSSLIAHEVRTPLGILRSSAQMLQREPNISDEARELVGFIESETERLNRLVSAMLDTARPRTPTFAAMDMHDLIRRTISMLSGQAESKGVRITANLEARETDVTCDEEQITQVVLNILMNGLQILKRGGRMEVSTKDDGPSMSIEIADDGPGIAPSERSKVFDAFFFKREGGIGLGLAIVQQIINAHSGSIAAVDSSLGGVMFRIRLPRQGGSS